MKKIIILGAFLFGMFATQTAFAGCGPSGCQAPSRSVNSGSGCNEQATGESYCLYVKYEPSYYTTKHCVEEQVPCQRTACRTVPKYHEVQRCRMVPQYYTEKVCKYETETYMVDEYKTCKKWVSQQNCNYVPKYYWKHSCGNTVAPGQSCNACKR